MVCTPLPFPCPHLIVHAPAEDPVQSLHAVKGSPIIGTSHSATTFLLTDYFDRQQCSWLWSRPFHSSGYINLYVVTVPSPCWPRPSQGPADG